MLFQDGSDVQEPESWLRLYLWDVISCDPPLVYYDLFRAERVSFVCCRRLLASERMRFHARVPWARKSRVAMLRMSLFTFFLHVRFMQESQPRVSWARSRAPAYLEHHFRLSSAASHATHHTLCLLLAFRAERVLFCRRSLRASEWMRFHARVLWARKSRGAMVRMSLFMFLLHVWFTQESQPRASWARSRAPAPGFRMSLHSRASWARLPSY
jgi:hypothetical protein